MVRILLVTGSPLVGMYYGIYYGMSYTGYLVRTSTAVFRSFQVILKTNYLKDTAVCISVLI